MAKLCIICDIDGTILDPTAHPDYKGKTTSTHELQEYASWAANAPTMSVIVEAIQKFNKAGLGIVIITSRPISWLDMTDEWLTKNNIPYDKIGMRPSGDTSPDSEVKQKILDSIKSQGYDPIMAFDNDKDNVKMYRKNGLPVVKPKPGQY